jgi:cytochrome c biogenesis protein ResB
MPGQTATAGGIGIELQLITQIPAIELTDLPGTNGNAILEMDSDDSGASSLTLLTADKPPLELRAGQSDRLGNFEYTFGGQRDFTGLTVRRDPGTGLVWVSVALLLVGLGITFYVPRRRLWVRLAHGRATFAGMAGIMANFPREMTQIAAEAGSPDAKAALFRPDPREEAVT